MDQRKFNALAFERTGVDDLSVVCEQNSVNRTAQRQGDITQHLIARGNDALNGVPPVGGEGDSTSSLRRIRQTAAVAKSTRRGGRGRLTEEMGQCVVFGVLPRSVRFRYTYTW